MLGSYNWKRFWCYALAVFFIIAGANHFRDPQFYLPLIPDYLPWPEGINLVSGFLEILFGGFLLIRRYRKVASYGILLLLLLFIPSHVHFITIGSCVTDGLCVPAWVGWIRLFVIHPLLLFWAWWVKDSN